MPRRAKWIGCVLGVLLAIAGPARPQHDASPGPPAEGFGASARGGPGGEVIWVTNLNSDGPGSLREAVATPGPRTIKFTVAGTIELRRDSMTIGEPFGAEWEAKTAAGQTPDPNPYSYVTVDGSSAPAPGITIGGCFFIRYGASHVILRHLRIRDNGFVRTNFGTGITVGDGCSHILIDHCSLSWGRTKMVTLYGACSDMTFQWCIVSDANKACFVANGADRITLHHNLLANNGDRSPLISGGLNPETGQPFVRGATAVAPHPIMDVRNNVIYNWHNVNATKTGAGVHANLVGNYYRPGPSSDPDRVCMLIKGMSVCYLEGNLGPRRPNDEGDQWADAGHIGPRPEYQSISGPWEEGLTADEPFAAPSVATQSAEDALDLVLAQAGAWPRDPIDAGAVRTVIERTGWAASQSIQNRAPEDFTNIRPAARVSARGDSGVVAFDGEGRDVDGAVLSYSWYFGDGSYGIGRSVRHAYAQPGEYIATLFVMDDLGMTDSASVKARVRPGAPAQVEPVEADPVPRMPGPAPIAGSPAVTVKVARTSESIGIGAFPSARDWDRSPRLAPFIDFATWRQAPEEEIEARVLHDGKRLYLLIDTHNPWPGSVKPAHKGNTETWLRGGIEMNLSPGWGAEPWFNFVVNRIGVLYDAKGFERDWAPPAGWAARSEEMDGRWICEVAIPFESFGMRAPEPGSAFGLKVCRMGHQTPGPVGGPWVRLQTLIWPTLAPEREHAYSVTYSPDPTVYARVTLE